MDLCYMMWSTSACGHSYYINELMLSATEIWLEMQSEVCGVKRIFFRQVVEGRMLEYNGSVCENCRTCSTFPVVRSFEQQVLGHQSSSSDVLT